MLSPGPVLLGRIRCAMDEPAKAAAGDVDGSPGSPGAEVDTEIQRNWQQSWQGSWDQRQTFWIQRWTRRTLLCLLAIVAACLSGGLAYAFYHSASFQSQLDPDEASSISLVCFLIASNALAGGSAVLLWLTAPTQHLLLAARFLMLNWFGGLSSLFLIELRVPVLFLELMGLQYLAQDRLKSIWPALNSPQWGACLGQAFWLEFGLLLFSYSSLMILVAIVWFHSRISVDFFYMILRVLTLSHLLSTLLFLMWVLGVATTLCRVVLMLRRTLQMARKEENSTAVQSLLACRRHSFWQAIGFLASLATTFVLFKVAWSESVQSWGRAYHHGLEHLHIPTFSFAVTQCINSVVNVAGVILFSKVCNIFNLPGSVRPPALSWTPPTFGCQVCPRSRVRHNSDADTGTAKGSDWEAKTEELASRGISLSDLLEFYSTLGVCIMTSFQPDVHTTNDVVRLGIIPRTASARSSYADFVNNGTKVIPKKMVTHNWQNLFRDLLATVIADALGEHNFELIAGLLSDQEGVEVLNETLRVQGRLQETYWICAFSVNQHASICGGNPNGDIDPVTKLPHPICSCNAPKFFNKDPPLNEHGESIKCEMNKFDDMMAFLARKDPNFTEVIAVDANLKLFSRAWCMAELAEAHRMGMLQNLMLRNTATLLTRQNTLQRLRVEDMKASRPEDVHEILAKIPDKKAFNQKLQDLIFDGKVGLLAARKKADVLEQMEDLSYVLKWARLSESAHGGALIWRRWISSGRPMQGRPQQ